jgi:hypothetical protein
MPVPDFPDLEQEFIMFLQLMAHYGQVGTGGIWQEGQWIPTVNHI